MVKTRKPTKTNIKSSPFSRAHFSQVTLSTLLCGFYPLFHSVLYIILQILGAIFGSLLASALVPGVEIGMGAKGPGCFTPADMVPGELPKHVLGWETIMTFALISVVYACGVAKPGHGGFTPLAVGLTLLACAATGGKYSGAFLNPARVLGPVAVFKCGSNLTGLSILGQVLAALISCGIFAFVSGLGPLHPLTSQKKLGLSQAEAIRMWVTGSPPARLSTPGRDDENITELLADMGSDEDLAPGQNRSPRGARKDASLA